MIKNKIIAERYMIVSSLGEGGMADVYLAIDTILNREVAIKVLRGELSKDPVTLLRFQREASAVSKLNHPNVVDVYDVGEFEERHYIVMEYIRGRTLKQLISQRGAIHQDEAVNIMVQLTKAVLHAHEHNIIHRDIKPQNVLVKDDGTIKITDFGIALAHDAVQLTQNDAVLGSAHYLAPETTRGETPTNQVDIYALGVVFYELLTGSVPFRGDNPVQIAMKHLRESIPSVKEFNPTLPQSVENIILHATVKNKGYRYQSAKEMLYDLEHCLTPEYANAKKLVFKDENSDPTRKLSQDNELGKRKVKTVIKSENTVPKKAEKKINKLVITGIVTVVVLAIMATVLMNNVGGNRDVVVPDISAMSKDEAMTSLLNAGYNKANITVKEELSDDIKKDKIISISPAVGKEIKAKDSITLTVSKGTYFIVEDYAKRSYSEVEKEIKEKMPNAKLTVTKKATAEMKPGYIIEQSGITIGEKLDPTKEIEIKFVVTDSVAFKIEGLVGKTVEQASKLLADKGIVPVLSPMAEPEVVEGQEPVKTNVITKVDPKEGTWYVQEGNNTITLYYYGES